MFGICKIKLLLLLLLSVRSHTQQPRFRQTTLGAPCDAEKKKVFLSPARIKI